MVMFIDLACPNRGVLADHTMKAELFLTKRCGQMMPPPEDASMEGCTSRPKTPKAWGNFRRADLTVTRNVQANFRSVSLVRSKTDVRPRREKYTQRWHKVQPAVSHKRSSATIKPRGPRKVRTAMPSPLDKS